MDDKNTVYVNTIYYEGGTTYRPFVTINTPKQWPTKKMAFFQSTGSSNNDGKNKYRKGTWLPTLGLLPATSTLYTDLRIGEDDGNNVYTDNYILKRGVFSKIFKMGIANWDRAILTEMLINVKAGVYYKIPKYLKNKIENNISSKGKNIEEEVKKVGDVIDVLASYCQFWWQVQISARLGDGLWNQVPEFRDFVLSHDYDDYTPKFNYTFTERSSPLNLIKVEYNVDENTKDLAEKVMAVLEKEDAILKELLYGDYREHKSLLSDIFKKGVSLSKQRKSKSRSISEIKVLVKEEPPTKKIKRSSSETKEEPPTKKIKISSSETKNTLTKRKKKSPRKTNYTLRNKKRNPYI